MPELENFEGNVYVGQERICVSEFSEFDTSSEDECENFEVSSEEDTEDLLID